MAEKSTKNCKSLSVFPFIVRPSDKGGGCLGVFFKYIFFFFPFGNDYFRRFLLCVVPVGEVIPLPLSMASKTLCCGFLAWRSSVLPNNTARCWPRARVISQLQWHKYQQTGRVPLSHTAAQNLATVLPTLPTFYLQVYDLCWFSLKSWLWESH